MPDPVSPTLHVCTTCRAGRPLVPGGTPAGQHMFEAVSRLLGPTAAVRLRPVQCLSSCDYGCTAAISSPGKWSYLLGRLDTALAADLLLYANTYARSATGTVLPSKRPASLARMVLGRMPDLREVTA